MTAKSADCSACGGDDDTCWVCEGAGHVRGDLPTCGGFYWLLLDDETWTVADVWEDEDGTLTVENTDDPCEAELYNYHRDRHVASWGPRIAEPDEEE